jgi:hypothetical protein
MIDIVDYETLKGLERSMETAREESPDADYARWKPFHDMLCTVAGQYGQMAASDAEPGDIVAPAEWTHLETDRFVIRTLKLVDPSALVDLQREVAGHHPNATLFLEGEPGGALADLMILITPAVILLAWRQESSEQCRSNLEQLGLDIDE